MLLVETPASVAKAQAALVVLRHLTPLKVINALHGGGDVVLLTSPGGSTHSLETVVRRLQRKGVLAGLGIFSTTPAADVCDNALALLAEHIAGYMPRADAGAIRP
jgi:D-arabinose 5-phosphate isomerase GutQ